MLPPIFQSFESFACTCEIMSLALGAFFIFFMSFVETKNVILSRDVDNRIENDAQRQNRINLSMPGKYYL